MFVEYQFDVFFVLVAARSLSKKVASCDYRCLI